MASSSKTPETKERKSKQDGDDKLDDKSYVKPDVPNITLNNEKTIPVLGLCTKKVCLQ